MNVSATSTAEKQVESEQPTQRKLPRVWPIAAILVLNWGFRFAADQIDMSTLMVFISRMAAHALRIVSFLIWWFANRRIRLADRFLAVVVAAAIGVVVAQFCDPTLRGFPLAMFAVPCLLTIWPAWVLLARRASPAVQRIGFCAVV